MTTETRTITESERVQAIGLLTVAQRLTQQLDQVERTLGELLGEKDDMGYFGLVSDVVSDARGGIEPVAAVDGLLRRLGITVED